MFNTAQLELIKAHVPQMRQQGYLYYLAVDARYMGPDVEIGNADTIFIYSKDPIYYSDFYTFSFSGDIVMYWMNSASASSYNTSERITVYNIPQDQAAEMGSMFSDFLWISTNAITQSTAQIHPDVTYMEVRNNETTGGLLFVVCIILFFYAFIKLFRR